MRIISIGDLATDFYYKNDKLVGVNGGMSSHNIIANIASFGLETSVYGVCGNDILGTISINSLKDLGVNVDNIKILDDISTRCFHVSYKEVNQKLEFQSKKRCPLCNRKKWYEESMIEPLEIIKIIKEDDILVFDNLNNKNQTIIDKTNNKKMLDLGQYFELDNYTDEEIIAKVKNKFDLVNLNERVAKYLKNRFSLQNQEDIYHVLNPKMLIITKGKNGADLIFNNIKVEKTLNNKETEIDPTGAGDAFFATFISEYIKNNYIIDNKFINLTYEKATKLTKKVVKNFSARGHIQKLYKIKVIENTCTCDDFIITKRKQIKRCNININNLETRLINAINSSAYDKLSKIDFENLNNSMFIATGGSYASAVFSSKVINKLYGSNIIVLYPRDAYYRNNNKIEKVFLFTYSGTTNDLIVSTKEISNNNKYIITKGEVNKIYQKLDVPKNNIISYRSSTNKGKEKGFLSFEGALAPSSLFLKLYLSKSNINIEDFIKESINYWKEYFNNYFKENKDMLKEFLEQGSFLNIFTGDNTTSASTDLESKIVESGIYDLLVHEKKNFSHGRFINYEHLIHNKNIYFKQKTTSAYEEKLLEYLKNDNNLIIESKYDGILCEYDLLVASNYLIYYISNFLNIDISKPTYSEKSMKIYFYKGEL